MEDTETKVEEINEAEEAVVAEPIEPQAQPEPIGE